MYERERYITTGYDSDKAAVGFSRDEFKTMLNHVKQLFYSLQLGNSHLSESSKPFIWNIKKDLELIDKNGTTPYELWMDYQIMMEVYHLVNDCDAGVQAEFQDMMREYEHLEPDDF